MGVEGSVSPCLEFNDSDDLVVNLSISEAEQGGQSGGGQRKHYLVVGT